MSNNTVKETVENASSFKPERPRPLMRALPPALPFPVNALGTVLGNATKAIHDKVQAPLAIGGQSVLAAATLAVQGHADVELPTGHAKPASVFFITVADTGERKTACDDLALRPVRRREKALRETYDADLPSYTNDKLAWDKAREDALKKNKGNRAAIKAALDALGDPPPRPLEPLLTCQEPTFEGLCLLYSLGQPSLGIFANEGGQFIGGHGMNDENKLRTATALSGVWDGETIRRVRRGDGIITLHGKRLAIHLMVQPDVASIMLTDRLLASQGLLSRLLVSAPDPASGTRFWKESSPESDAVLKRYGARLLDILESPPPLAAGKVNELDPRRLPLSPEARALWIAFADHVERRIAPNGELEPIRGLANKLPEHAARLAAVLALVNDIHAVAITGEHMAAGIELAKHYAGEAMRLFGASRIHADLVLAQKLLGWLHTSWQEPLVSLPDIYQRSPIAAIRDKSKASAMTRILEEHGWLIRVEGGAVVAGEKRRDAWRIVKEEACQS